MGTRLFRIPFVHNLLRTHDLSYRSVAASHGPLWVLMYSAVGRSMFRFAALLCTFVLFLSRARESQCITPVELCILFVPMRQFRRRHAFVVEKCMNSSVK